MGFFNFFSKEKKETLDKGLSKTKESVFSKIARAVAGKSKVDDEVLDNLEEVLKALDILTGSYGYAWSPKRITVSTVGLRKGLRRFIEESDCHLAISL